MKALARSGAVMIVAGLFSTPLRTQTPSAVLEGTVRCASRNPIVVSAEAPGLPPPSPQVTPPIIDQRGLEFVPRVLPVVVGTRVAFRNSDPVPHNVFSPSPIRPFNLGAYPSGTTRYVTFDRPGVVEILCNVHLEMNAYVVVLRTPSFTVAREDGHYRIEGLSPGPHTVSVWCDTAGATQRQIQLGPGTTRFDLDLSRGDRRDVPPAAPATRNVMRPDVR